MYLCRLCLFLNVYSFNVIIDGIVFCFVVQLVQWKCAECSCFVLYWSCIFPSCWVHCLLFLTQQALNKSTKAFHIYSYSNSKQCGFAPLFLNLMPFVSFYSIICTAWSIVQCWEGGEYKHPCLVSGFWEENQLLSTFITMLSINFFIDGLSQKLPSNLTLVSVFITGGTGFHHFFSDSVGMMHCLYAFSCYAVFH